MTSYRTKRLCQKAVEDVLRNLRRSKREMVRLQRHFTQRMDDKDHWWALQKMRDD